MKPVVFLFGLTLIVSCSADYAADERAAVAPELPPAWSSVLGDPAWQFRWYGADGTERSAETGTGKILVTIPDSVSSPVLAYPFWPRLGIPAGLARPAGAIFPYGLNRGRLSLSWRGGVAGVFYRELLHASGGDNRAPRLFDWPRFLELLDSDDIDEKARADPWTVDWRAVAVRTRVAGFDRRRLKPRPSVPFTLPLPGAGPWTRSSPFLSAVDAAPAGGADVSASAEPDTLLSRGGFLRFDDRSWAWFPNR